MISHNIHKNNFFYNVNNKRFKTNYEFFDGIEYGGERDMPGVGVETGDIIGEVACFLLRCRYPYSDAR
jgi:hypothetical protein